MESSNEKLMFDQIYYINLDRRPDRKENVEKLIKKHNLDKITQRIPAIDGTKLDLDKISNTVVTKKGIDNAKNKKM
jgi:GR25 family glycosyltransferase involved in LPS biosynthesis